MDRARLGHTERLWIATEIYRLVQIANDTGRPEHRWAVHLIQNAFLWYWTSDGLNTNGVIQRDLLKHDIRYLRHTAKAADAIRHKKPLIHEHAVPRTVLVDYLKRRTWTSPEEIVKFLDRFCFGVVIEKDEEKCLKEWSQKMPTDFSEASDPLERYKYAKIQVIEPVHSAPESS